MTKPITAYEGGYYILNQDLVRAGLHSHTRAIDNPISAETMDALNRVQRTPWRINGFILDTMTQAYASNSRGFGLPYADTVEVPRKTPEEWEVMTEEQRNQWKFDLSELHGQNARMESRRKAFLAQIEIAREMRCRDSIWFPHFLDFRGRFYPMVQVLHPQCDDLGKALLEFAEGQPLGERGLFWLKVRAANCYGHDKVSLADRVEWVNTHIAEILDSADDPLDGSRFWADADEPWGFLATCHELRQIADMDNPEAFVSHLPVQLDGSCNGLQHLSAMGRDPIGAKATNVAANRTREDIYSQVAEVVKRMVAADAVEGNELAHEWVGKITRKVVKRAVMTTPYGVTERGIAEQLMTDGHTEGMTKRGKAATYLKDKIVQALDETVTSAKAIMAWVQTVAAALADAGQPFTFMTPTGNLIQQSYYHLNRRTVVTLSGELVLWEEDKTGGLQARKQMLASAPNLIHAFDASHMTRTINALVQRLGRDDISLSMIHDSYGVHANRVDALTATLREEFVDIYRTNWLDRVEQGIRAYAPDVDFPSYTEFVVLGDFDVSECLDSEFFFA